MERKVERTAALPYAPAEQPYYYMLKKFFRAVTCLVWTVLWPSRQPAAADGGNA